MEQQEQHNQTQKPSYWPSVTIAALIFGIIYFIVSIIAGYAAINAEPSGSMIGNLAQTGASLVGCLLAAFGGMLAIWHYCREYDIALTLGKGALIGLFTGIGIVLILTILSKLWTFIDPTYSERMMQGMIDNFEAMEGLSDAQRDQMIDGVAAEFRNQDTLWGIIKEFLLLCIPLGILNLLTAMLGVKFFAKKEEF